MEIQVIQGKTEEVVKKPTYWAVKINNRTFNTKDNAAGLVLQQRMGEPVEIHFNESTFQKDGKDITMKWFKEFKFLNDAPEYDEEIVTETDNMQSSVKRVPVIENAGKFQGANDFEENRNKGFAFGMAINAAAAETAALQNGTDIDSKRNYFVKRARMYFEDIENLRKELLK